MKTRLSLTLPLLGLVFLLSCDGKSEEPDPRAIEPDEMCPGMASCLDEGEELLMAGAAKATITPDLSDKDTMEDVNDNGDFEPPPIGDDVWHDNNENGEWDFVWIAGYGMARPANDVHDDLWARTVVLRWKSTTIAVVALDLVGYFWDDAEDIRDDVADLGIDFVIVHGTHDHEAPDVIGIWGFNEMMAGWDQDYIDMVRQKAAGSIRDAYDNMVPATAAFSAGVPAHPDRGVCNVCLDGRDPFVIIENLTTIRFIDAADESTIATLINWAGHPESAGSDNHSITADYPYYVREGIEKGVHRGTADMDGVGGIAIFIQGALGSQIGCPGDVECEDLEGNVWVEGRKDFGKVQCIGENIAVGALEAMKNESEPTEICPIEFRKKYVDLVVENYGYHAMILNDVFHIHRRDDYGFDRTRPIREGNWPHFETEVSWVRIGPAQAILIPGELTPELAVGGYDGSHTPECAYDWVIEQGTLSRADNPNPPDLTLAPGPPYLFDFLTDPAQAGNEAAYPMIWGLTNDFLGYFVPPYNYELAHPGAYIEEAPGDHYEETNSVGPAGWPEMERNLIGIMVY